MSYRGFGYIVDSCPQNLTQQTEAASRLNCSLDEYGTSQYVCAPNAKKSAIIEYCYDGLVGLHGKGNCLEVHNSGKLDTVSCENFAAGCTTNYFKSFDLYKYPACHQINTRDRCFYAEPTCAKIDEDTTIEWNISFSSTISSVLESTSITNESNETPNPTGLIVGISVALLIALIAVLLIVYWFRNVRKRNDRRLTVEKDEIKPFLPSGVVERIHSEHNGEAILRLEDEEESSLENENEIIYDEKRNENTYSNQNKSGPGDHIVWKTSISDHFSKLSGDEVSVLFSFLCCDSGVPDFSDADTLDILNAVRQRAYNIDPLSAEEAEQSLDRLKRTDFFFLDQNEIKLTQDTADEVMFQITAKHTLFPFCYCGFNAANEYLRSRSYKRKAGEKCIIPDDPVCETLLLHRLQMNILTHVTMEDSEFLNRVVEMLNAPEKIVKGSLSEREVFLKNLEDKGKPLQCMKSCKDIIQRIKWQWKFNIAARPDIVRSSVGLFPHWDIYIINNKPFYKPSKYHDYPANAKLLLFSLLLVDKCSVSITDATYKHVLKKIRQRYFNKLDTTVDFESKNLPDEIRRKENGDVTFVSDEVRQDVMYTFSSECLVEECDVEFFLKIASKDLISEYCRSWRYKKSDDERCLYVPGSPLKMFDLVIEKLQLDIITHRTVSDTWIHGSISLSLGVPFEILKWDQDARERYVECARKGTQTVHHARGMIVGCAGAGKTTILKRLLKCSEDDIRNVTSTRCLEVHEEIFQVCDETKTLKARASSRDNDNDTQNNKSQAMQRMLSFFDFGGQCAYYACHQIYLTRRAFYVVVVDASKRLSDLVDSSFCDQQDTVFHGWTYRDYFIFWLKSIYTYCYVKEDKENNVEIIIVATHWEDNL